MGQQTKKSSIIESIVNTLSGLLITLIFSPFIYGLVGIKYTFSQLGLATILFMILSIARGYVIRRFFNKKQIKYERGNKGSI
jgi:membrane protein implicated in regulation of membrane protease activity